MQATYRLQRSSGGIVMAVTALLAALILGGAGGYILKSATAVSVSAATVRSNAPAISAPSTTQTTRDTSAEARRHFRLAN